MGRSFDRGGQSRKERMRGKRRAYLHAERDREAQEAVRQAKRENLVAGATMSAPRHTPPVTAHITVGASQAMPAVAQKRPGFFSRTFGRLFGKAA
jgi:RecA-family ATPase